MTDTDLTKSEMIEYIDNLLLESEDTELYISKQIFNKWELRITHRDMIEDG